MTTFFETQPLPGPLSRRLHGLPRPAHLFATASNHAIELAAPAALVVAAVAAPLGGGRGLVAGYGLCHLLFQGALVLSGNLSFLNWLTAVPAAACFDDALLAGRSLAPQTSWLRSLLALPPALALAGCLAWLNAPCYENLVAPARRGGRGGGRGARQRMNASFDRVVDVGAVAARLGATSGGRPVNLRALRLANAYGAFGVVATRRDVLVVEGSRGAADGWAWREFDVRSQPADLGAAPVQVAPWHWRLDWQLWIAACRGAASTRDAWFVTLLLKLAENDGATAALLRAHPFLDGAPPTHVRVSLYRYAFAPAGENAVWTRERRGVVVPPTTAAELRKALGRG